MGRALLKTILASIVALKPFQCSGKAAFVLSERIGSAANLTGSGKIM